jgi:HIV Tat-specific factor 1
MADSDDHRQPSGFPQSPSAFDDDRRVSFSKLDDKYILESDEGTEYEWDSALRRWIPVVGFDFIPM